MTQKTIHESMRALKVGQTWTFGYFWAKKKTSGTYCLFDSRDISRSRWGNLKQICDDIEYVITYNTLPRQQSMAW